MVDHGTDAWEAYGPDAPAAGQNPLPASSIPFGFTTFPGEIWRTPPLRLPRCQFRNAGPLQASGCAI